MVKTKLWLRLEYGFVFSSAHILQVSIHDDDNLPTYVITINHIAYVQCNRNKVLKIICCRCQEQT